MSTLIVTGNLAADPELRYTPAGTPVVEFVVLENRRHKNDADEWEDAEPNRFRVTAWRALAENIAESVAKGDRVIVEGTIKTNRWHDRESGEVKFAQTIDADQVGVSLQFHTARPAKTTRAAQPATAAPADPWTTS